MQHRPASETAEGLSPMPLHIPVMTERVVELFAPVLSSADGTWPIIVDATIGMGGHAAALLATYPNTVLIGIDRDPDAITRATARLAAFKDRIHLVHTVYDHIDQVVSEFCQKFYSREAGADAILLDCGVSSRQLDEAERGFAYSHDVPLDMRMDTTSDVTAEEVVNSYSVQQLSTIIADYGEERFARRIAQAIVRRREHAHLTSSMELAELVRQAIPAPARRSGGHPAKRTFQALRIEVNQELDALRSAIPAALRVLRVGGRIVVMSYHSLEDRIVKQAITPLTRTTTPVGLPTLLPDSQPELTWIIRGAEQPSASEIASNPRAASARLRAAERLQPSRDTNFRH